MNFDSLIEQITPEIYAKLREAVALGKWFDGNPLSHEQKESCLQAIIAYEQNLPENQRTGFIQSAECATHDEHDPYSPDNLNKAQTVVVKG